MPRSHSSPAATVASALLALIGCGLALVRGGVDWPVQLAGVALACAAFLLVVGYRKAGIPLVVIGLTAVTCVLALQLLPVPPFLHRLMSPQAAQLFDATLRPLGLYPAARPISLDPPATGRELAKAVACLLAAATAAHFAASRRRRDAIYATLALAGIAVSAAGLGAALVGLAPLVQSSLFFVNTNHLAGFLGSTAFIALGFGLRSYGRARLLWLAGFAVLGAGIFLSLSRGGIAAFFVGAGVFGLLWARRNRNEHENSGSWRTAAVPIAVSAVLAISAYVAIDPLLAQLRTIDTVAQDVKLSLWPTGLALLRRFPLTGIGRGSFATAFTAYKVGPEQVTFTHLENEWLQTPIDLGIPVGLLLIGVILYTWFSAARARDLSRPEIGALAGAAALAAQNAVDFSLEILGVAVPLSIVLGLLSRTQPSWSLRPALLRASAVVAFAFALAGMGLYVAHSLQKETALLASAADADTTARLAREAARWHPADYFPQATAGARLVQEGRCSEALPWLSRAMLLNPTASEPHRFAARCLAAGRKRALALREYRLAILLGDTSVLPEAARAYPALDDLLKVAPDTPDGLLLLGEFFTGERPADAQQVFRRSWESFGDTRALQRMAQVELTLGNLSQALTDARTLQHHVPGEAAGYITASATLTKLDRLDEARRELELGASRLPGSVVIMRALASQALAQRRFGEAQKYAESIAVRNSSDLITKRLLTAQILWVEGRAFEAIAEARSARDASPQTLMPYLVLAEYCEKAGLYYEAIEALRSAAALPGASEDGYQARIAKIEELHRAQRDRLMRERLLADPPPEQLP